MQIVSPLVDYFLKSGYCEDYTSIIAEQAKTIVVQFDNVTPSGRLYFPSDSEIDGAEIKAIEVVTTTALTAQPQIRSATGDFFPNISDAQASNLTFGLAKGSHIINRVNLRSLVRTLNAGKICRLNSWNHIWQDCFLEIENNTNIAVNQCVMLIVYFNKPS